MFSNEGKYKAEKLPLPNWAEFISHCCLQKEEERHPLIAAKNETPLPSESCESMDDSTTSGLEDTVHSLLAWSHPELCSFTKPDSSGASFCLLVAHCDMKLKGLIMGICVQSWAFFTLGLYSLDEFRGLTG